MKPIAVWGCSSALMLFLGMAAPAVVPTTAGERVFESSKTLPVAGSDRYEASRQAREKLKGVFGFFDSMGQAFADFTGSIDRVFDYEGGYNDKVFFSGVLYFVLIIVLLFVLKLAYNILKGVVLKIRYQLAGDSTIIERYRIPWFRKNKSKEQIEAEKEGKRHLRDLME